MTFFSHLARLRRANTKKSRRKSSLHKPTLNIETLEERRMLTTTVFLDFGDGFAAGMASISVGDLRDIDGAATGPDLVGKTKPGGGAFGAGDVLTLLSLDSLVQSNGLDFDGNSVVNAADTVAMQAFIVDQVGRAFEPFDVDVEVATSTSIMTDVMATFDLNDPGMPRDTGPERFDAYMFSTGFFFGGTTPAHSVGASTGVTRLASGLDYITPPNNIDEAGMITAESFDFSLDPVRLATQMANQLAHSAGHTFTLDHSNSGMTGIGGTVDDDLILITRSDLMVGSGVSGNETDNFSFFSRREIIEGNGNVDPLVTVNAFTGLRDDAFIGLQLSGPEYVTGTGGHDRITITRASNVSANVKVETFRDATIGADGSITYDLADLIDQHTYLIDSSIGILVEAGDGVDQIIYDADIGQSVTIRGGENTPGTTSLTDHDELVINGSGAFMPTGSFDEVLYEATGPGAGIVSFDDMFDVNFSELEPITLNVSAGTLTIAVNDGLGHNIALQDDGNNANNMSRVTIDGGLEDITFVNPNAIELHAGAGNDTISLVPLDPGFTGNLEILGGADDDLLTVDSTDGLLTDPANITFDGGDGFDRLYFTQEEGTRTNEVIYVGALPGNGRHEVDGQVVDFENLEPITTDIASTNFSITSDPGIASLLQDDNEINYSDSDDIKENSPGRVTIDNFDPIEFLNKTILTINAGAGRDNIVLDNADLPLGLEKINVNGNEADDIITAINVPSAADTTFVEVHISGNDGQDYLDASQVTQDTPFFLEGNEDNDTLLGGAGLDSLVGNSGNDLFFNSPGDDSYDGGTGDDILRVLGTQDANSILLTKTTVSTLLITVDAVLSTTSITDLEKVEVLAGDGDDTITVNPGDAVFNEDLLVLGEADDDQLIIDTTSGLFPAATNVNFDGGSGFDRLDLTQSQGIRTNESVIVGALPGNGRHLLDTQTVNFENIEPLTTAVPTVTFEITSIPGVASLLQDANEINYIDSDATDDNNSAGRVTIDNFEPIEFLNKTVLIIDAGAGRDNVVLDNADLPIGLEKIQILGDEADDILTAINVPNAADTTFVDVAFFGGNGHDLLDASQVTQDTPFQLFGNEGNDTLLGGAGSDNLFGNIGDDLFFNSPGDDKYFGESGDDILRVLGTQDANSIILTKTTVSDLLITVDAVLSTTQVFDLDKVEVLAGDGDDTITVNPGDAVFNEDLLVQGEADDDQLIVDTTSGLSPAATNVNFNGGSGFDRLDFTQSQGSRTNESVIVGALPGSGRHILDTQVVNFENIEPLTTNVVAATFNITSVPGIASLLQDDNQIDYSDGVLLNPGGRVTVDNFEPIEFVNKTNLVINAGAGNDHVFSNSTSTPTGLTLITVTGDNGHDVIEFPVSPVSLVLNGLAGNDIMLGGPAIDVLNGGFGNDTLDGGANADTLNGNEDDDILIDGLGDDNYNGDAGNDIVRVLGTINNDAIFVNQSAAATLEVTIAATTATNTISGLERVEINAGDGDDIIGIQVAHGLNADSLPFSVDGESPNASDRLLVADDGIGNTIIHNEGPHNRSGSIIVGALMPIDYDNIEKVDILPIDPTTGGTGTDGLGRVVVFDTDPFEANDDRLNPTDIVALGTVPVNPNINPGGIADPFGLGDNSPFALPGDEDWYKYTADKTGVFRFDLLFTAVTTLANGQPGLPGDGLLQISAYDESSAQLPKAGSDTDDTQTVGLMEGQTIFLRVRGKTTEAINVYDLGVEDLDDIGPQITDVYVTSHPDYNLFAPKPDTDGPTPSVDSISIDVRDLPDRALPFLYPAIEGGPNLSTGLFSVVGDHNGIIAIESAVFTGDTVVAGSPATGTIELTFVNPLPDDRFTLTVYDELTDPPGNQLDGESNASQPVEQPQFPTGNNVSGGDFVARFTVDHRAEIGVWSAGSVYLDTNGNFTFDPENADATNRDIVHTLGFTSDFIFAGNFYEFEDEGTADGFDKLAAYGKVGGSFRWLIDLDNDGVPDLETTEAAGFAGIGIPVAGNFDGNSDNGDEIGLFTGTKWYFDTDHDFRLSDETPVTSGISGLPVVGDFDADGEDDLATWAPGTNTFYVSETSQGGGPANATRTFSFRLGNGFPFIGARERPVAGDLDGDGFDELGLFVPDRSGVTPEEKAEWYFLSSDNGTGVTNRENRNEYDSTVIDFTPTPFGPDIFAHFGDDFAIPIVGNFDPPVSGAAAPDTTESETTEPEVTDLPLEALAGPLEISGTDGNDVIEVQLGHSTIDVTVNGSTTNYNTADIESLSILGGEGNDRLTILGTSDDETATMRPGEVIFEGPATPTVNGSGFEEINAYGRGGADEAFMHDSNGDDTFSGRPVSSYMRGEGYVNRALETERVTAYSTTGNDIAYLNDSIGDDVYVARPNNTYLTGDNFYYSVKEFHKTYGYSTHGGTDIATLYGSTGDDLFVGKSGYSYMVGDNYHHSAIQYAKVYGRSVAGGTDKAYLYDSTANDIFVARSTFSYMVGGGFHNNAIGFGEVTAYASEGSDRAYVHEVATNDAVTGQGNLFSIERDNLFQSMSDFDRVSAYSGESETPESNVAATDYFFEEIGDWL